MDMDNLIHDMPPPIGGLKVLVVVSPALGNKVSSHSFL